MQHPSSLKPTQPTQDRARHRGLWKSCSQFLKQSDLLGEVSTKWTTDSYPTLPPTFTNRVFLASATPWPGLLFHLTQCRQRAGRQPWSKHYHNQATPKGKTLKNILETLEKHYKLWNLGWISKDQQKMLRVSQAPSNTLLTSRTLSGNPSQLSFWLQTPACPPRPFIYWFYWSFRSL